MPSNFATKLELIRRLDILLKSIDNLTTPMALLESYNELLPQERVYQLAIEWRALIQEGIDRIARPGTVAENDVAALEQKMAAIVKTSTDLIAMLPDLIDAKKRTS
jgi:hypothetical protein